MPCAPTLDGDRPLARRKLSNPLLRQAARLHGSTTEAKAMETIDFYKDKKFCPKCSQYVSYLMSIHTSYCTTCGGEVKLFSKEDWEDFNHGLNSKRPKAGRPRKQAGA